MQEYLNFDNSFYIEAGANDGTAQSNTIDLEKRGWRGLLIEPNKQRFAECKTNRSDWNIFENCALVSFDHQGPTIQGNFAETNLDASLVGQVTIPLDYYDVHQRTAAEEKADKPTVVHVPARTLQSIIDEHGISQIDFMSLDVEGYEYEVMNGLDFTKNPPRFIRVETSSLDYRKQAMIEYLTKKNYRFLGMASINDCFFEAIREG
jgi:FkbM family methyltransferase